MMTGFKRYDVEYFARYPMLRNETYDDQFTTNDV